MNYITHIKNKGTLFAIFYSHQLTTEEGINFLTDPETPLQIGLMERPAGYEVQPHRHPSRKIEINHEAEFLYIESGRIVVTIFDDHWVELTQHELGCGDFILLIRGGHQINMLEPSRIIAVKQGPFIGNEESKTYRDHDSDTG